VIPINTNIILRTDLWAERIRSSLESGLSRKDWCQQNEIPQPTLNYWIREFQSKAMQTEAESVSDPVFAKLPAEQDLLFLVITGTSPVTILLPENIRIEVGADCSARLIR